MRPLRAIGLLPAVLTVICWSNAAAQGAEAPARRAWQAARTAALDGRADSALALYARARILAQQEGDSLLVTATLRGAAQVHAVHIGCGDSAAILFREAVARSGEGDRQSADAYVRLLATRGNLEEAQRVLNVAYASVEGLGRSATRESMHWHQGMAAIQRASGRESGALASLTTALSIAARLRSEGAGDGAAGATGDIDPLNYWLVYDLAQLRLHAKAAGVANPAGGRKLMDALVTAGIGLDEQDNQPVPVARLFDTLLLRAHQCTMNAGANAAPCPAPSLAKCASNR
jgi:hypothetical protein